MAILLNLVKKPLVSYALIILWYILPNQTKGRYDVPWMAILLNLVVKSCEAATKKFNFPRHITVAALKCTIVPFKRNILRRQTFVEERTIYKYPSAHIYPDSRSLRLRQGRSLVSCPRPRGDSDYRPGSS